MVSISSSGRDSTSRGPLIGAIGAVLVIAFVAVLSLTSALRKCGSPGAPVPASSSVQTLDTAELSEIQKTLDLRVEVETDPETGWNQGVAVVIGYPENSTS